MRHVKRRVGCTQLDAAMQNATELQREIDFDEANVGRAGEGVIV
jgi:hypothetical protein